MMEHNEIRKDLLPEENETAALSRALSRIMEAEGEEFLAENEALRRDGAAATSPELDQRCLRAIRQAGSGPKRKTPSRSWKSVLLRASLFFLVFAAAVAIPITSVTALRSKSMGFVFRVGEKGTTIATDDKAIAPPSPSTGLGWFPTGTWECTDLQKEKGAYYISRYADEDGANTIEYQEIRLGDDPDPEIDTQGAEVRTDVRIYVYSSVLVIRKEELVLTWTDTARGVRCTLTLTGPHPDFTPNCIYQMANSVYLDYN